MARKEYTKKQKQEALKLYVEIGQAKAAKTLGIPKGTICSWARRAGVRSNATEKTEAASKARRAQNEERMEEVKRQLTLRILDLNNRMDERHKEFRGQQAKEVWYDNAPSDAVKAYATSIGILIDKYQLLTGGPTGRNEHTGKDGAPLLPISLSDLAARAEEQADGEK